MKSKILLFLLACSSFAFGQNINDDLVAYYRLNNNALDESGYGNDGAINGSTPVADKDGNANSAFSFDGVDDCINISDGTHLKVDKNYTVSFWAKFNDLITHQYIINFNQYNIHIYNGELGFQVNLDDDVKSNEITSGAWAFYTFTYDNGVEKIYIDNILKAERTVTHTLVPDGNLNFFIGKTVNNNLYFNGSLDEIRIYTRTLSETEITTLYGNGVNTDNLTTFTLQSNNPACADADVTNNVAWTDINNDSYPDLYLGRSDNSNLILVNNQQGGFNSITSGKITSTYGSLGVAWADIDNDGWVDALSVDGDIFYNDGDETFTEETAVFPHGEKVLADVENDGDLDVYVVVGDINKFYINNGDKTFTEITSGDFVNSSSSHYGAYWTDLNNDGYQDLFVASGNAQSELYINNQDGTFTTSINSGLTTYVTSNESVCFGDINNDGYIDALIGGIGKLYINNGDLTFTETANPFNGGFSSCAMFDYDNDGYLDIFTGPVNGTQVYKNNGDGSFTTITESVSGVQLLNLDPRGAASADFNRDGYLDFLVGTIGDGASANGTKNMFLLNTGNTNNWLQVKLNASISNKSAIGARIKVTATINGSETSQIREISTNTSGFSQSELIQHFGLGNATSVTKIEVYWPSGMVSRIGSQGINQLLTITEPASYALQFDGVDDYIHIPEKNSDNFQIGQELTIEAWIKPTAFNTIGYTSIVDIFGTGSFYINENGNLIYHYPDPSDSYYETSTSTSDVILNSWQHISMTRDASNLISFYYNGELIYEATANAMPGLEIIDIGINYQNSNERSFTGLIDEVRIWNTVRSEQQIKENMNNYLQGSETGLIAYYQINESSGQIIYDRTNNGYNGTLGNGVTAKYPTWISTQWPYYQPKADLQIPTKSLTTQTVAPGGSTTANFTIENQGEADAGACTLKLYLSTNTTYEVGDEPELKSVAIGNLASGTTSTAFSESITVPAGTTDGNYYILYIIDSENGIDESNETNNMVYVALTVETPVTVPAAPSNLQATATSESQIELTWTDNSDNESGFEIHRSTSSGAGFTKIHTTTADVVSYTDQGLNSATTYYYKIRATNEDGIGGGYVSDFTSEVFDETSEVPPANPSDLSATAVSKSQINLSWTDNSNNEEGFKIYRSSTNGEKGTLLTDGTLVANVTTFQNTGLDISTTYYYTVCGYNSEGESCSAQVSGTTLDDTTPDVTSASCCVGSTVPNLTATGENIKWYSDIDLTNHVHSGTSFSTGHTEAATYTYYATQTINAIESEAATVTLTIHGLPTANAGEDFSACSSGVQLNANTPTTGSGIWSTNGAGGNFNDDTSPSAILTGVTPGSVTLTWEVTDANNCINSDDVAITVNESPAAPKIHRKGGYIYICTTPDLPGYQWYKDDIAINGETGQYYIADKNSTSSYALEITGDNGCKTKVAYVATTKTALSLDETVQLYPNPVAGQLNIEMDNDRLGTILMKVLSQAGEVLYVNEINKDTDWLQYQLGLETLKQGYYLIEFHFSSDEKVTKKILKM